jgi:uncharacterized protein (DUF58 family)
MIPTTRAAALLGCVALSALVVPVPVAVTMALVLAGAVVGDALTVRAVPEGTRSVPRVMSRGVPSSLQVHVDAGVHRSVTIRQASPPDLQIAPQEAVERLDTSITPRRRGRHLLPPAAVRREGPLGLGAWHHHLGEDAELVVYPDLPAARRLALAVRRGRFGAEGQMSRGPLGLGTDFESIRDYLPDDDVRQVNWRATARLGRAMSNQYRIEQDRDVVCVVDIGRLMSAPIGERTRLDAAVDAVAAVALVADQVGDRCGTIAFDARVHRKIPPRRGGGDAVVKALFDLEPTTIESDYELAFRAVGGAKRAFVVVLTDLLEEAAARPLVEAVPLLARRHAVVVASASDPDLDDAVKKFPGEPADVYGAAIALDVLAARSRVAGQLRRAGASVLEAPPRRLGAACVDAYLRAKARARL